MYIFDGKVLDAYGVLGLQSGATDAEVKRAYRKLSRQYHPDFNADNEEWAHKKMQVVNAAHDEIVGRRKDTYIPSMSKYQASDGSRPDLEKTETERKSSSTAGNTSNGGYSTNNYYRDDSKFWDEFFGNDYGSNTWRSSTRQGERQQWRAYTRQGQDGSRRGTSGQGTSSRTAYEENGHRYEGNRHRYEKDSSSYSSTRNNGNDDFSSYIFRGNYIKSQWLHFDMLYNELMKKYNVMSSNEEKGKLSKLIDIFMNQMLAYSSFHSRFSKYISLKDFDALKVLNEEFDKFNRQAVWVKEIYKYMNEEMPFMMSAVSTEFSGIHSSNYISIVEVCIYTSVYFDNLIKDYIKTYVRYNTEEQFKYAYDRIVKEFNLFLSKNGYNINNLNSFIKSFKLKKFLKDCCSDFRFDENYVYRGKYTR